MVDRRDKIEGRIPLVNDAVIFPVQEVAELGRPPEHERGDLLQGLRTFLLARSGVPFRQSNLALTTEKKDPPDLQAVRRQA